MNVDPLIAGAVLTAMIAVQAWVIKTVIDLRSDVAGLKARDDAHLRELDKLDKKLDQLWED